MREADAMDKGRILSCDTGAAGCRRTIFYAREEAPSAVRRSCPIQSPRPNRADARRALPKILWRETCGKARAIRSEFCGRISPPNAQIADL